MEQELWNRNCGTDRGETGTFVRRGGGQILFFKGLGRVDR